MRMTFLTQALPRARRILQGPVLALVSLFFIARSLSGESVINDVVEVPVDRVVRNVERLLDKNPNDVQLRVNLARVHMMAFVLKSRTIVVNRGRETDGPATGWLEDNILPTPKLTSDQARSKEARDHLALAVSQYERVIRAAPDHALARLGYAWALQQSGAKEKAVQAYREAVRVAWPVDRARPVVLAGWRSITEEAARYLIPLLDPARDADEIATLRGYQAQLEKLARAITPIAIPLRDDLTAQDLTDTSARVPFDLDGSGLRKPWTWITKDAGWLVMDRHRRGQINSGLQLFGNVTFWLFWANGYDAMRALDDDADGRLRGGELDGLAIWQDANRNGVSEPGEVRPLHDWHIVELSCVYAYDASHPDEIAFSSAGVRFEDGRTRPTFDLVLHRSREPLTQPGRPTRDSGKYGDRKWEVGSTSYF